MYYYMYNINNLTYVKVFFVKLTFKQTKHYYAYIIQDVVYNLLHSSIVKALDNTATMNINVNKM